MSGKEKFIFAYLFLSACMCYEPICKTAPYIGTSADMKSCTSMPNRRSYTVNLS